MFQSLFYWITYSYLVKGIQYLPSVNSFNPYFIGLPILIILQSGNATDEMDGFNPYFIGLPILITIRPAKKVNVTSFNPYFIGLPILIRVK